MPKNFPGTGPHKPSFNIQTERQTLKLRESPPAPNRYYRRNLNTRLQADQMTASSIPTRSMPNDLIFFFETLICGR